MPSKSIPEYGTAGKAFREAFERLRDGVPAVLPKGTAVTQNNVAREDGKDPSALRKSRFPTLVAEIQAYVERQRTSQEPSARQDVIGARRRNSQLKEKIVRLTIERDHALSLIVQADAKIVELTAEVSRLRSMLPASTVTRLR